VGNPPTFPPLPICRTLVKPTAMAKKRATKYKRSLHSIEISGEMPFVDRIVWLDLCITWVIRLLWIGLLAARMLSFNERDTPTRFKFQCSTERNHDVEPTHFLYRAATTFIETLQEYRKTSYSSFQQEINIWRLTHSLWRKILVYMKFLLTLIKFNKHI
jgi:hypothetical protein